MAETGEEGQWEQAIRRTAIDRAGESWFRQHGTSPERLGPSMTTPDRGCTHHTMVRASPRCDRRPVRSWAVRTCNGAVFAAGFELGYLDEWEGE